MAALLNKLALPLSDILKRIIRGRRRREFEPDWGRYLVALSIKLDIWSWDLTSVHVAGSVYESNTLEQ